MGKDYGEKAPQTSSKNEQYKTIKSLKPAIEVKPPVYNLSSYKSPRVNKQDTISSASESTMTKKNVVVDKL